VGSIAAVVEHLSALRGRGVGILIVTHLLGFARRSADHVMFMDSGSVLEAGGKEVLEAPTHPKLKHFMALMERSS
jgi:polar amino acid transport system ATP-binding protein